MAPPQNAHFLEIAESLKPVLTRTPSPPLRIITVEPDASQLLGWRAVDAGSLADIAKLEEGDSVILDFGGHRAGYFSFDLVDVLSGPEPADAPARLRLVFGEVLNDVAESFEPYNGWLSKSWLPEEVINIDLLPQHVEMPRRYAFRYVKVTVVSTSQRFAVKLENCLATAVSSAPRENPKTLVFPTNLNLSAADEALFLKIDNVALETLRNCMQTVYEDGPRRDMRLWIGDLRLQALSSYCTFKDYKLVKRCLYLFAAMPFNEAGLLCACVYEKPVPRFGGNVIVDYSMLFGVTLLDYVVASQDFETGRDLYAIALKQFELHLVNVSPTSLLYEVPEGKSWHFIDWQESLDRTTAIHSVLIFGLKAMQSLAQILDLPAPSLSTPHFSQPESSVASLVEGLIAAAREHMYDSAQGVFVSGDKRQVSWASQAWAVIAGIPSSKEEGVRALRTAYEDPEAVGGTTPYLHHYLCEAFIVAGLDDLALGHIKSYWGSMVEAGAATFFEAWDPKKPTFSPYGDLHVNSFCHAWSCTPSLLLRQLGAK
ncbi:hypothetical protein RQP46_009050 [Phenoliferia psychrophenolica]